MRLWTVHPRYLDTKGLTALWREGLLALTVLQGKTKCYKNHPQLDRFKSCAIPVAVLGEYLRHVYHEANARGHKFDESKLPVSIRFDGTIPVTDGQLAFEAAHLCNKLWIRDDVQHAVLLEAHRPDDIEVHPLFHVIPGDIEPWERIK
jgi:hypothetical protein